MEMLNVSYDVTKEVGKVVQELQGILELFKPGSCNQKCISLHL